MNPTHNPYLVPSDTNKQQDRLSWLERFGVACCLIAGLCLLATIWGMCLAFEPFAANQSGRLPNFLYRVSSVRSMALTVVPLGMLGLASLVAGRLRTRMVDTTTDWAELPNI